MDPIFLGLGEIFEVQANQVGLYGGSADIRDLGLLTWILAMPRWSNRGIYLHADMPEMAAAYLFHIVKNHPFVDGNKRVGTMAAYVFLRLNGLELACTNDALVKLVLAVADSKADKAAVAAFFRRFAKP